MSATIPRQVRNVTYDFTGQVVVITGGARGQGKAHALAFARAGASVVISDIGVQVATVEYALAAPDDLTEVAREIESHGVECLAQTCDVRDEAQVAALSEAIQHRFGRVDVLINNAGIDRVGHVTELSAEAWDDMMDTHLRGAFLMSKAVVPFMRRQNRGKIIMTGSIGSFLGIPHRSHYVTAKHGLLGLTRALALDLARYRVNVNMVCPGAIRTPLNAAGAPHPEIRAAMKELIGAWNILEPDPAQQLLDPEEISHAMLWLASDASDFVTGAALVVDAGASIK